MSLLTDHEEEEESEEEGQARPLGSLAAGSIASTPLSSIREFGVLLSQTADRIQSWTAGPTAPAEYQVQNLKMKLRELCPTFSGNFVSFQLPLEINKQLLRELPEVAPEFTKNVFKTQTKVAPRSAEEMKMTEGSLVDISKNLSAALIYLLSTAYPKTQKGHLMTKEAIFRAICLTATALNQVQTERFADPLVRQCLVSASEKEEVPEQILDARKQLFFPQEAGVGDFPIPSSFGDEQPSRFTRTRPTLAWNLVGQQRGGRGQYFKRGQGPRGPRDGSPASRAERDRRDAQDWMLQLDPRRKQNPWDAQWSFPGTTGGPPRKQ
jgi:hypothetical protein